MSRADRREMRRIKDEFLREVRQNKPPVVLPDVEIKRLRVEPGDILVLTTPMKVRPDTAEMFKTRVQAAFGTDIRVVVLDGGMNLAVVNESELAR